MTAVELQRGHLRGSSFVNRNVSLIVRSSVFGSPLPDDSFNAAVHPISSSFDTTVCPISLLTAWIIIDGVFSTISLPSASPFFGNETSLTNRITSSFLSPGFSNTTSKVPVLEVFVLRIIDTGTPQLGHFSANVETS